MSGDGESGDDGPGTDGALSVIDRGYGVAALQRDRGEGGRVNLTEDDVPWAATTLANHFDLDDAALEAWAVSADREQKYGGPRENMEAIARLWSAYLRNLPGWDGSADPLGPADVAEMMVLLKMARFQTGEADHDHFVDQAGYARVADDVSNTERGGEDQQ